jgi:serine/threonine-protein kinase
MKSVRIDLPTQRVRWCTLPERMERSSAAVGSDRTHGKYHPIAELGQGGTANVYLAVARGPNDFNKLVVLKVLRNELADEAEFRQMFMSEARLAARLNHPNVVQTNEILQVNGRPVIVMEYLEGQTLSRIMARSRDPERHGEPLPLAMQLRVLIDVLSGLHYSHELADYDGTQLHVVHRDMTPQNVFVSYDGRVCVLDFGIAKLTGTAQEQQTGVGVVKGKLRYMPAEQLLATNVDRRADIFAVGVMLWEAATGEKMWRGQSDGVIINSIINGNVPSPREVKPDLPAELERIIMKALAFEREDRYPTAAELQADLEHFLANEMPTNRAIGKVVSELFEDDRRQMRSLIERQLSSLTAQAPSLEALNDLHLPPVSLLPRGHTGSMSRPREGFTGHDPAGKSRGRMSGLFAAFLLLAVALLSWWKLAQPHPPAPELRAQPVQAPPEPEPATVQGAAEDTTPPAPEPTVPKIALRVSVSPANAQLYLDDRPLPSNPYSTTLTQSDEHHTIRAEAPGHVAVTREITYGEDADVELALEPVKSSRRPSRRPAAKPAEEAADDKPADACAVPYYMDEKGIRRIKRQCL